MSRDLDLANLRNALRNAEAERNWQKVVGLFERINAIEPLDAADIGKHALAVMQTGDLPRAATLSRKAVRAAPESAPMRLQLAKIYMRQKRHREAERAYREALELAPDSMETLVGLANVLQRDKARRPEAEMMLKQGLEKEPENLAIWAQLGAIYGNDQNRHAEAEEAFLKIYRLNPESPSALHNLGLLYRHRGRLDEAEDFLRRAVKRMPNDTGLAFSLAQCLLSKEDLEGALEWFQRAAELDPTNNTAHVHVAFTLFHMGRTKEAWAQYEKRLDLKELKDVKYDRPRWTGNRLNGETVLLMREQGVGDNLQFIRYVPIMAARGARVIVLAQTVLERLFKSVEGATAVMTAIPAPKHFHRYIPLMSLPHLFGTGDDDIPADIPYLEAPEDVRQRWAERLGAYPGPRVGLVWRGNPKHANDHFRSSSLEEMSQLLQVPGVTFFSLHKERPEHERELPEGLIDIGSEFEDFADTAGAIDSLDAVVTVDTSVCHLAGAIGATCWTMLPRSPDFRWGLTGETTPWYPTMKLYRQEVLGDWTPVYDRIAADLRQLAG